MRIEIQTKNKKQKHKQIKELNENVSLFFNYIGVIRNENGFNFFNFIGVIRNFQILFASLIKFSIAVVFWV